MRISVSDRTVYLEELIGNELVIFMVSEFCVTISFCQQVIGSN